VSIAHKGGLDYHETSLIKPFPVQQRVELLGEKEFTFLLNYTGVSELLSFRSHSPYLTIYIADIYGFLITQSTNIEFGLSYQRIKNTDGSVLDTLSHTFGNYMLTDFTKFNNDYYITFYSPLLAFGNLFTLSFRALNSLSNDLSFKVSILGGLI
jgi:hypothetical protein